jgi:hypothetical protein
MTPLTAKRHNPIVLAKTAADRSERIGNIRQIPL